MTKEEIKQMAQDIYTLAGRCKVPMLRACRSIGMATSTPHRWLHDGSEPEPGAPEKLRASILRVAAKHDTLPAQYLAEFDALPDEPARSHRPPREIARDAARYLAELDRALAVEC